MTSFGSRLRGQLDHAVLAGVQFGRLHNDIRYPKFSERHNAYSVLEVGAEDAAAVHERLDAFKMFLADIDRFRA